MGRVYISGDTDITEESKAVSCDIALLPVGGTGYTMNAEQAAELAAAITVIPVHYGKPLGGANAAERFRAAIPFSTSRSGSVSRSFFASACLFLIL